MVGWNGSADDGQDFYRLPVVTTDIPVTFAVEGQLIALPFTQVNNDPTARPRAGDTDFSGTLPAEIRRSNLRVQAGGPYTLTYGIPGWKSAAPAQPLPVQLGLPRHKSEVAAFWQTGQALQTTSSC